MLLWLLACVGDEVVVHNDPPDLSIVSPVDLDTVTEGFPVAFEVIVSDDQTPLDELTTLWVSDRDGELEGDTQSGERLIFEATTLSQGDHRITVYATDTSGGVGETSVLLTVRENTPPEIAFTDPTGDAAFAQGASAQATVRLIDDTEPDLTALTLAWWLDGEALPEGPNGPGGDATATVTLDELALGEHTLSVTVWDTPGASAQAELALSVLVPDADGDGFESDRLGGTDCDDDDPGINPSAVEICDDADNDEDCNGLADDDDPDVSDPAVLYVDGDGDGYGATEVLTCEADSAVADGGDCDDADPLVNPGANEVCDDGVDNNCDGAATGCRLEGELDPYAAEVLYYGATTGDELGYSLGVGDVNGDGLADLALGARKANAGDTDSGALVIVHSGSYGERYVDEDGVVFEGTDYVDYAGSAVAYVGDLDGDGNGEVLVGALQSNANGSDSGQAYLLYGPMTVGGSLAAAGAVFTGEDTSDNAGSALASAGDVDADGIPDLLIGAEDEDSAFSQGGAGYLYLGPVTGSHSLADADGKFRAEAASDHLGRALAGVGDTNGDGYDDMLIGAPDEDEAGSAAGAAYLVLGDTTSVWNAYSLRVSAADAKIVGDEAGAGAGESLAGVGDLDGDGFHELVIGAWNADNDTGRAHLVYGPVTGSVDLAVDSFTTWEGSSTNERFGISMAAGDFDADGVTDLLAGASDFNSGASSAGTAWLFYGPWATGPATAADVADGWLEGTSASQHTGFAVGTGDVDGDGKDDVVVSAYNDDTSASNAGMVTVTLGQGL